MTDRSPSSNDADTRRLVARRRRLLGPAYRLFYRRPLHIVRGEGVWLIDAEGRRYLDMYNNVPHVGHCNPHVVEALTRQISTLNTHTRYLHENVVEYAERLLGYMPAGLDVAMFSCTGSEANELALRIARAATGNTGVIATEFSYHGNTQATADISTEDTPESERPPWVVAVPAPDVYRGRHRGSDAADRYADCLHDAIAELARRGVRPAAFIADTIISSSGVVETPPGYLARAADIVRDAGGLFIADEVQPGLGRTGRHFWGFEADGLVPDIVTMGKPMGNGHPLAATVAKRALAERFATRKSYFNTFGGNPVSAAAGLAVLDVLERDDLQRNALDVGDYLKRGLERLATTHPCIGDVRGQGLFLAVELVDDRDARTPATVLAAETVESLRNRGILTNTIGPDANILKLRPPMVFRADHADLFLEQLNEVLGSR